MTLRQIALATVLAGFSVLTLYVLVVHGYAGVIALHTANTAGLQVILDLVIALSLVLVWMSQDAKAHGLSFVPYLVLTLVLGSIGPLVYLLRRESRRAGAPAAFAPAAGGGA
jgi:hypothetical protein